MADLISEIVSQEALEQVTKLTALLKDATGQMDLTIAAAADFNKSLGGTSVKSANDAINNLNTTQQKLIETESERLNIERQIKAEGEKMAANVKVTSTAIDAAAAKYKMFANSQKELAQYIVETDRRLAELKDELKNADKNASNYTEATARMRLEQAKLKAELSEATKELKRTVTEQKFADDSMKGMSVRLQQLKDVYSQFTETERNSDFGLTISAGINELDEKLKGLDKSIGDNQRNVGNYEVAQKSLKAQLKEIVNELAMHNLSYEKLEDTIKAQRREVQELARTKGVESEEYRKANIKLAEAEQKYKETGMAMNQLQKDGGKLKDIMRGTNEEIMRAGEGEMGVMALQQGVGALADTYSVFQAGMVSLGFESEALMETYAKMMLIQQGVAGITGISNALQKESMLMLQLKNIKEKVALVFTQKRTAATIENTAATAGAAAATGGLAAAEGVATKTSWTLAGSIKAVGVAIKSIPVIGWILAAVAALGTLTVLLYKHLQAEKELTAEQENRKRLSKDLTEINQKTNESTLENITRVKLLQKELGNVVKGSKEYQSIVKEIDTLTGSQYDTIKATPAEIAKGTAAWIQQYKTRAKGQAIIERMVENELEFEKLKYEVQIASAKDRKETIDKLPLLKEQKDMLLSQLNLLKETVKGTQDNVIANQNVQYYLKLAETNMRNNNAQLEKQITLVGMLSDEEGGTDKVKTEKEVTKQKFDQYKLERLIIEMRLTGIQQEESLRESRINKLKQDKATDIEADPKRELEITQYYNLEIEKVRLEHAANIKIIEEQQTEDMKKFSEERIAQLNTERDAIKASGGEYAAMAAAMASANQNAMYDKKVEALESVQDSIFGLGVASAQYIKDEKTRVKTEQGLAMAQILLLQGIALAKMTAEQWGDPYTYVPRLIASAAAIASVFMNAINAINQAKSVPLYAEGTDYHKGGAAIVGEGGQPEMISVAGRNTWITEPTYIPNLPVGASVTPLSDMEQSKNMNDYWLEKIANGNGASVNIDVSGRILPSLRKDMKVIRFANKLITARS